MDTSLVKRYFNKISPRCTAGTNIFGDSSVFVEIYILKKGETYSSYFLAYKKGKLLFSGFPYEFISNDDSLINSIGNKTSEYYEKNCD
ncbi:MAG: hypothetical protein NT007_07315 [Candidatus Kapabacteria bacterium]|nr:hypothetical protein [Candidatus Kapabacteria bacterium]